MRRRLAVSLLVLFPALVAAVGFAATSGMPSFKQPRGAMPIEGGYVYEPASPSTGGFSSNNVTYEGSFPSRTAVAYRHRSRTRPYPSTPRS